MPASGYTYVEVKTIVRETDKAYQIRIGGEDIWVPKSVIADEGDYEEGQNDVGMSIKDWFCEKEGIRGKDK